MDIPGRGQNKINAAYAFGGPSLLVRSVEQLTRIRIDHYLAIDFAGFAAMTDAIGGVTHQHLFLRALMAKATDGGQLRNPVKLTRLLDAVTKSLSVDSGLSAGALRSLALSLRDLRGRAVQFVTVPVTGTGRVGTASVVFLDPARAEVLYQAVRADRMASYRAAPPGQ